MSTENKKLADMTPAEREAAIQRAASMLQAELTANAPAIAAIMDEAIAPEKFRVDVLASGESNWAANGLRFDTEDQALAYAHDLYSRWTLASKMRIVPESTPQRERYVAGAEHPDWANR